MGQNNVKKLPVTTTDLAHHVPERGVRMAAHREPEMDEGEFE